MENPRKQVADSPSIQSDHHDQAVAHSDQSRSEADDSTAYGLAGMRFHRKVDKAGLGS